MAEAVQTTPRIIQTDTYAFAFDGRIEPIATVEPGEFLEFHTDDAFCSGITEAGELPSTFQVPRLLFSMRGSRAAGLGTRPSGRCVWRNRSR